MTRDSISIDDMAMDFYDGIDGAMIKSTRWGMEIWHIFVGAFGFFPYIYKFLGVVFLIASAILFSSVLYSFNSLNKNVFCYTFTSVIFITFPLINNIWEYTGANMIVCGNMMIVFFSILIQSNGNIKYWRRILASGLLMTLVASSYESGIFVYITTVLVLLFYKYIVINKSKSSQWIVEGIRYIPSLIIAVLLRYIIGFALIWLFKLQYAPVGAVEIMWGKVSVIKVIGGLVLNYLIKALVDPSIALFVFAFLVLAIYSIWISFLQKSFLPIFLGLILFCSVFLISIIQFTAMPYRAAQTITVFVSFVVFLVCNISVNKNKALKNGIIIILLFVSIFQASFLGQILHYNILGSENDISIVRNIGFQLNQKYYGKQVVFCGDYNTSEYIEEKLQPGNYIFGELYRAIIHRIKTSSGYMTENYDYYRCFTPSFYYFLRWSYRNFSDQQMMKKLFSYCGYDIDVVKGLKESDYNKFTQKAEELNMKPFEMRDMGKYVLVYLGELKDY